MRLALAAGLLSTIGCGVISGARGGGEAGGPSGAASTATGLPSSAPPPSARYGQPRNACAALSATTTTRYKLINADESVHPGLAMDPVTRLPVDVNYVGCSWSISNPARGAGGRPNWFTLSLTYWVPDPNLATAEQIAQEAYRHDKEKMTRGEYLNTPGTLKSQQDLAGLADEAYYTFTVQKATFGTSSASHIIARKGNAYVRLALSGADLRKDPSLPRGMQLVTRDVDESRLKPAIMGTIEEALGALR
jgi:hypothetical protein